MICGSRALSWRFLVHNRYMRAYKRPSHVTICLLLLVAAIFIAGPVTKFIVYYKKNAHPCISPSNWSNQPAYSPDCRYLVVLENQLHLSLSNWPPEINERRRWVLLNAKTNKLVRKLPSDTSAIAWLPDNRLAYISENTLMLLRPDYAYARPKRITTFLGAGNLTVDPSQPSILAINDTNSARFIDLDKDETIATIKLAPDENVDYVGYPFVNTRELRKQDDSSDAYTYVVRRYEITKGNQVRASLAIKCKSQGSMISTKQWWVFAYGNEFEIYKCIPNSLPIKIQAETQYPDWFIAKDGRYFIFFDNGYKIYDLQNKCTERKFESDKAIGHLRLSSNGSLLLMGFRDRYEIYDFAQKKVTHSFALSNHDKDLEWLSDSCHLIESREPYRICDLDGRLVNPADLQNQFSKILTRGDDSKSPRVADRKSVV